MFDLFSTEGFTARSVCSGQSELQVWLQVAANAMIAVSYYAIPVMILLVLVRNDGIKYSAHGRLFVWFFAAFILACGTGHVMQIALYWWPAYNLDVLINVVTGVISLVASGYFIAKLPYLRSHRKRREALERYRERIPQIMDEAARRHESAQVAARMVAALDAEIEEQTHGG